MSEQPAAPEKGKRGFVHAIWGMGFVLAFLLVFGLFTQLLWNWLMPAIFNLPRISYLQALGLLLFSRILFGRVGQRRDHAGYLTGKYGFRRLFGKSGSPED